MATELNFEQQLADMLETRNFHPETLGKDGRPCDAQDAKTFSFDYVSSSGHNYGTMVIAVKDDGEVMIMFGDNLGRGIENDNERDEFFQFHEQIMQLIRRQTGMRGNTADINKLKRVQAGIAAIKEGLFEGYYGNRRTSYAGEPTEARLMIRHNRNLGEGDARFRYVESVFIETADGERFKLPFTHLPGARAMLEHVRQGGRPYDIRGCHIAQIVTELKTLTRFNRATAGKIMEGVSQGLIEQAQHYHQSLKENLRMLGTGRGYTQYFESWHPADVQDSEDLVENIKQLFIEQTLDTRIEAALPLLARLSKQGQDMKEVEIFETWVNRMTEGTWNLPETPEQVSKLKELMSKELIVGPDATNATEQLYDLVGDDELFDRLSDLARRDPRANAWNDTEIMDRLRELGIDTSQQQPAGAEQPAAAAEPAAQPAPPLAQQQPVAEDTDILQAILKHAGVPVKENIILDETGETLQHIMSRFKKEVRDFQRGAKLDRDLYDALYDYYYSKGEMPYGVAKVKTGDPAEWVSEKFDRDLGGLGFRSMAEADPVQSFEDHSEMVLGKGECNKTMEGEYCPEHGLAECGYMESMGGTVAGAVAPMVGEQDIAEASYIDGRKQSDDELVWKQTSLSLADAAAKYGKENAKIDGKNRMGKPIVIVKVPLASKQGVAEDSLNEFAPNDDGDGSDQQPLKSFKEIATIIKTTLGVGWAVEHFRHPEKPEYIFMPIDETQHKTKNGMARIWSTFDPGQGENPVYWSSLYRDVYDGRGNKINRGEQAEVKKLKTVTNALATARRIQDHYQRVSKLREDNSQLSEGAKQQGVAEGNDDPMNYNAAITGSYYESQDQLARIKELALRR